MDNTLTLKQKAIERAQEKYEIGKEEYTHDGLCKALDCYSNYFIGFLETTLKFYLAGKNEGVEKMIAALKLELGEQYLPESLKKINQ